MNNTGNLLLIILLGIIVVTFALPVAMYMFKPLDLIVRVILIFVIVTTVRGYLGNGIVMLIVSGILIYFLVFKWWWLASSSWLFLTLLSIGFFGVIVWGLGTTLRKG